jgi:hypothetical protein
MCICFTSRVKTREICASVLQTKPTHRVAIGVHSNLMEWCEWVILPVLAITNLLFHDPTFTTAQESLHKCVQRPTKMYRQSWRIRSGQEVLDFDRMWSKSCNVFLLSNTKIVGSNPTRGIDVYVPSVLSFVGEVLQRADPRPRSLMKCLQTRFRCTQICHQSDLGSWFCSYAVRKGCSRAGTDFLYFSRYSVIRFTNVSFVGSNINFRYAIITIVFR